MSIPNLDLTVQIRTQEKTEPENLNQPDQNLGDRCPSECSLNGIARKFSSHHPDDIIKWLSYFYNLGDLARPFD